MKQLRLSTLSLCCLTAIMSPSVFAEEIKPLLQEGKTTLYQRVLSTKKTLSNGLPFAHSFSQA